MSLRETVDLIAEPVTVGSVDVEHFRNLLGLYDQYIPPKVELQRLENVRFTNVSGHVSLEREKLNDLGQWM